MPTSQDIRRQLSHPVIDGDGHTIEYLPDVVDRVRGIAGPDAAAGLRAIYDATGSFLDVAPDQRKALGMLRVPWWALPSANTRDRATAMLPGLLHERMDELGIDFAIIYTTYGILPLSLDEDELRRAGCRAFNQYSADAFAGLEDRLTPAAVIPMHTPDEAIAELEYCVRELRLKTVMLASYVQRPLPGHPDAPRPARWMDTFGIDSAHDYDPVWAKCVELGVAPTFHSAGFGWGSRNSVSNYMYNHVGSFAEAAHAICRGLLFAGVPRRFPTLRFGFLEGGVNWACSLYADFIGHWQKRNDTAVQIYDPARLDRTLLADLCRTYGHRELTDRLDQLDGALRPLSGDPSGAVDEFSRCAIERVEDVRDIFETSFFFGCEADDPLNTSAFDRRTHPLGAQLNAVFSSDIGHWDVPDMREVLEEAHELVDNALLSPEEFREFVFANAARMLTDTNPDFFRGTVVESAVARLRAEPRSAP